MKKWEEKVFQLNWASTGEQIVERPHEDDYIFCNYEWPPSLAATFMLFTEAIE